ncbi:MAG: hypothetical protein CMB22_00665 [Euryarchaeota archaeon]|nr:hypothetical protein [Euryarchaeota archaeon]
MGTARKTQRDIEGWAITVGGEESEASEPTVTVWVGWTDEDGMSAYGWSGRRVEMFAQEWTVLPGGQGCTHSGWCPQGQNPMPWWAWNIVKIRLRQEEDGVI